MATKKEMQYVLTKKLGGEGTLSVELGHYIVDGKEFGDKVYVFEEFCKRDGSKGRQSVGKFTVDEFNIIQNIGKVGK